MRFITIIKFTEPNLHYFFIFSSLFTSKYTIDFIFCNTGFFQNNDYNKGILYTFRNKFIHNNLQFGNLLPLLFGANVSTTIMLRGIDMYFESSRCLLFFHIPKTQYYWLTPYGCITCANCFSQCSLFQFEKKNSKYRLLNIMYLVLIFMLFNGLLLWKISNIDKFSRISITICIFQRTSCSTYFFRLKAT